MRKFKAYLPTILLGLLIATPFTFCIWKTLPDHTLSQAIFKEVWGNIFCLNFINYIPGIGPTLYKFCVSIPLVAFWGIRRMMGD